jgi:hypothetical protein
VRLGKVETEVEDPFSSFGPMSSFSSTIETFELSNTTPLRPRQHRARRNTTARAMDDSADGGDVEDGADDSGWGAPISEMMSESSAPKRSQHYITNKLSTEGKVEQKWRAAAARTLARGACGKSTTCVKCNGKEGVVVLRCNDCSTNGVHYCKACFELNRQGLPQHQIEFTDSQGWGTLYTILRVCECDCIARIMKIPWCVRLILRRISFNVNAYMLFRRTSFTVSSTSLTLYLLTFSSPSSPLLLSFSLLLPSVSHLSFLLPPVLFQSFLTPSFSPSPLQIYAYVAAWLEASMSDIVGMPVM